MPFAGSSKPSKKIAESEDAAQARMRALRKKLDLEAAERRKREEMSKNRDRAKAGDSMGELSSTFACAAKKVFCAVGQ